MRLMASWEAAVAGYVWNHDKLVALFGGSAKGGMRKVCPFKIGDKVRFNLKEVRMANAGAKPQLKPGTVGRIAAIHDHRYLRIGRLREWWHWNHFTKA